MVHLNRSTGPLIDPNATAVLSRNGTSVSGAQDGTGSSSVEEQTSIAQQLRRDAVARYRPLFMTAPSPIRVMARMVAEVQMAARKAGVSPQVLDREVANRTIGDVNVRMITEKIGGVDYSTIGEDLGLITAGEQIGGRISDGRMRAELQKREDEVEQRLLTDYNWDIRIYDVFGVGNPLLRETLAHRFEKAWGIKTLPEQTYISIGALDALYKAILSFGYHFKTKYGSPPTLAFPAPGFAVVNWHARMNGLPVMNLETRAEDNFKLNYSHVQQALKQDPNLRILYFTVSNNPTAFSYSPDEIRDVYRAIEEDGRELAVLADLAYVGTGIAAEDEARMAAFNTPEMLNRTLFINSLSKVFTLTGDRFGWVSLQNSEWADILKVAWNNITAGLPAEWQLRYTVLVEWLDEHPEIQEKVKKLYELRREHFRKQLTELNARLNLFDEIGLDDNTTIYNWSKLKPGEDALSLFEKTGIAGVSGGAFGYDNSYIRFSVGFIAIE